MKYCGICGHGNDDDAKFCGGCGRPLRSVPKVGGDVLPGIDAGSSNSTSTPIGGEESNSTPPPRIEVENNSSNTSSHGNAGERPGSSSSWVDHINEYMGNDRPADLNWRVLFTDVFKRHTKDEAEEIFICGTRTTTPSLEDVSQRWPHPWLYSRVFLLFMLAFVLLYICCTSFGNENALPGLMVVGSFTVPLTGVILFLELNAFRNISLYDIALIFLVGGCASLVVTLTLYSLVVIDDLDYWGALLVGIVEETGKAVIIYYFIKKLGKTNILPGLLIGAAVGAGFAAFESSGYAMSYLLIGGWDGMMDVIQVRGVLTPGGHIAWSAITGAAMVIASKEYGRVCVNMLASKKFLRLFIIPVLLHMLWDSPLTNIGAEIYLGQIVLTLLVWIVVLILINMGLSEIAKYKSKY